MGNTTFKSHGKFLITAEYLILNGAIGLALPLNRGQILTVKQNNSEFINWESSVFGKVWFACKLKASGLTIDSTTDDEISKSLIKVLSVARDLNPQFLLEGVDVAIDADFNLAWGLGSSSTLINNVSEWAQVDPYILLKNTFGGSGYDIACAGAKGPITYRLAGDSRTVEKVDFHPSFSKNIFFVYLGKKMNSRTGMSYFKEKAKYGNKEIERINSITEEIISCKTPGEFEKLLNEHETIMSSILQMPTIKESSFKDYPYTIKSMGAWGGDFVLVTGDDLGSVKKYFHAKGLETVVPYHEIVLS
jgi:mevalonate kinase